MSLGLVRLLSLFAAVGLQFLALEALQLAAHPWGLYLMIVGFYVLGKLLQRYSVVPVPKAIGWGIQWAGVAALGLWAVFMIWLAFFW
ncbi:hypothetical protein [Rufibacter roseus]|uniref:Uncharacterized protein n=1 Tax=Rufibacter roseus TaxID=1567108 RepID=A0ABW2DR58_9BACT|nr:hypothetical protein [Rufibacter roseus]